MIRDDKVFGFVLFGVVVVFDCGCFLVGSFVWEGGGDVVVWDIVDEFFENVFGFEFFVKVVFWFDGEMDDIDWELVGFEVIVEWVEFYEEVVRKDGYVGNDGLDDFVDVWVDEVKIGNVGVICVVKFEVRGVDEGDLGGVNLWVC